MTDPRRSSWRAHRLPATTTTSAPAPARSATRMRHSALYTPPPASWLTLTGEGTVAFATTVNTTLPITGTGQLGLSTTVNAALPLTGAGAVAMGYSTNLDLSSVGTVGFIARPNVGLAETGSGAVAFTGAPNVALAETGGGTVKFTTTVNTTLAITGSGTLNLPAAQAFAPSGMFKNGTFTIPNSYTTISGWTADTASYPGSTVSGTTGLVVQNGKSGASIVANIPWTSSFSVTVTLQLFQGATMIAQGTGVTGTSGTSTASATGVTVAAGDVITVKVLGSSNNFATVTSGAGTFVRIT